MKRSILNPSSTFGVKEKNLNFILSSYLRSMLQVNGNTPLLFKLITKITVLERENQSAHVSNVGFVMKYFCKKVTEIDTLGMFMKKGRSPISVKYVMTALPESVI